MTADSLRRRLLVLAVALGGCSALPPEPVVPLRTGEIALGATLDVPLGRPPGGLSVWAGVGVGGGVDISASAEAPLSVFANLRRLETGAPLALPGLSVRRTFRNGLGVGVGTGSSGAGEGGAGEGDVPFQFTAGPFVTVGTTGADGIAARATGHLVYEIRHRWRDTTATTQRGLAVYGVASAGLVVPSDSGFAVPGARITAGRWIGGPAEPVVTLGAFVQGTDAFRPLGERESF
jgi:hypothetical protein